MYPILTGQPQLGLYIFLINSRICDLIFDLKLSQIVDSPTHIQENTLNFVLTNLEDSIHSLNNCQSILSDHHPISFAISYSEKTFKQLYNPTIYIHDFLKENYEVLLQILTSDCYNSTDGEFVWSLIKRHVIVAMELYMPKFKVRTHQYPKSKMVHHLIKTSC